MIPADAREAAEILAAATADRRPVAISGGGSKAGVGRPGSGAATLSTTRLSGVIDYDPAELVLTARAGTRLDEIETLVAGEGQMLAFEPFDFGPVFGRASGASTLGGVVGAGIAGSRRLSAGNVRDHVLGFSAVSGRGDIFKAGGRVVKNVTGYDVSKVMAGSWGRLALLTEITLKVLPRPRETLTLALRGLPLDPAMKAIAEVMRSQAELAAAAHIPADESSLTLFRLEGVAPSVEARAKLVSDVLSDVSHLERLPAEDASALWASVRDASRLGQGGPNDAQWRISLPLSAGGAVAAAVTEAGGRALIDWAGGLVWALAPPDLAPVTVRELAAEAGGDALLVRAPETLRQTVPALHPPAPGVAALEARVRAAFDPAGILDPHRFGAGA
ncbi:MAG: glycolate oxidase subunit GlcE [Alphaproteobacteria bacterium]|nr:glycolate oxidase subunit GlcE [Alphaproteobacteria bacterium]